jgi:hypothetical protein
MKVKVVRFWDYNHNASEARSYRNDKGETVNIAATAARKSRCALVESMDDEGRRTVVEFPDGYGMPLLENEVLSVESPALAELFERPIRIYNVSVSHGVQKAK